MSKQTSLRALLPVVAAEDLHLHLVDIKTAFLNGIIEETIYVQQPSQFSSGDRNMACRLLRSLYGLRQAPRAWHARLKEELLKLGFAP